MQPSTQYAIAQEQIGVGPAFRLSDICKLMKGRYGGPCRTANAERYLMAAIPELMRKARSWRYAVSWAADWTPDLLRANGEEFIHAAWDTVSARKHRHLTTDQLSRLLKVGDDEPAILGLRCIPAASRTKQIRKADRKAKNAKAEAARRLRKKPDLTPRSMSLMATKPWEAAGMGRSKWYATRKDSAPVKSPEATIPDGFVSTISDPARGQFRGHQIPCIPFRDSSGLVAALAPTGAADTTPARGIARSEAANENVPVSVAA